MQYLRARLHPRTASGRQTSKLTNSRAGIVLAGISLASQVLIATPAKENHYMDNAADENLATETKPIDAVSVFPAASVNKLAANRMANKQRKKRAHRRKLRRSNTKG
jgi:hypothetical protein